MGKNKIVEYYKPNDERMDEYYFGHLKLLGLDKQPFGLDENGTLRFESKDTDSKVWKRYKELGGSVDVIGDLNTLSIEFQHGAFTLDEFMQFYREDGCSLCHLVDAFSSWFYALEDTKTFQKALDKLKDIADIETAKQDVLDVLFLANLDSVDDELILKYRIQAKKIINENFGKEAWGEFVNSIRNKKNEG